MCLYRSIALWPWFGIGGRVLQSSWFLGVLASLNLRLLLPKLSLLPSTILIGALTKACPMIDMASSIHGEH